MERRGFTLIELLIGVAIVAILPNAVNFVRARVRAPRSGASRQTSSRLVLTYWLDLTAQSSSGTATYTFNIRAYPKDRSSGLRWFYIDQTGMIRAAKGWAGSGAPPAS
jgi:prepilin-type N-terminal cleavage/methylation domain-containing protein